MTHCVNVHLVLLEIYCATYVLGVLVWRDVQTTSISLDHQRHDGACRLRIQTIEEFVEKLWRADHCINRKFVEFLL